MSQYGCLGRIGKIGANAIQKRLNGGILDSGTKEDWGELKADSAATNRSSDLVVGGNFVVQKYLTHLFVNLCQLFDQFLSLLLRQVHDGRRDFLRNNNLISGRHLELIKVSLTGPNPPLITLIVNRTPVDEINYSLELFFQADRYLYSSSRDTKL
jgi:hypothetical protein